MPATLFGACSDSSTLAFAAICTIVVKAEALGGSNTRMRLCTPWASFTSGAESSDTSESLRMPWDEDCRTAGLGKTERPVGWEGNGEPARETLVRHCRRGNPQKQTGAF